MGHPPTCRGFCRGFCESFGLPLTVSSMMRDGRFERRTSHAERMPCLRVKHCAVNASQSAGLDGDLRTLVSGPQSSGTGPTESRMTASTLSKSDWISSNAGRGKSRSPGAMARSVFKRALKIGIKEVRKSIAGLAMGNPLRTIRLQYFSRCNPSRGPSDVNSTASTAFGVTETRRLQ